MEPPATPVRIKTYDRGTTSHTGPQAPVTEEHSTPLKLTSAANKAGHPSQGPPSADTLRKGLGEDMKGAVEVGPRDLLSNLFERVAKDENADGNIVLKSIEALVSPRCDEPEGALRKALRAYLMSLGEKSAYEPFVKLCNEVLNAARTRDLADDIDKHLKPEDPKCKIEFIRYEKLFTEYDWTDTHNPRTAGKRFSLTVKPDILVVRRDGIEDYKANQAAVKGTDFDPSEDPTSAKGADCRVRVKDVLSYIELKWKEKAAILQINQGLKPPRVSTTSKSASKSASKSNSKSTSQASSQSYTLQSSTSHHTSQTSAQNSLKRVSTQSGVENLHPGKYQKTSTGRSPTPSIVTNDLKQVGHYAAELLSRGPYATHAIGIKIQYDDVQICWFNRQSTIATAQFSLIGDFPLFVASIIAFSRFSLADWGIEVELYPTNGEIRYPLDDGRTLRIDMTAKPLCHRVGLHGRGTMALRGELYTGDTFETPVVIKISHPETRRTREPEFIKAGGKTEHKEHFAEIYFDKDLGPPTSDIRHQLGLTTGCERQRRIIVYEPLVNITSLTKGKHFARVWVHCLKAHRTMWKKGYEHGDISLGNLMYRKRAKGVSGAGVFGDETRRKGKSKSGDVFGNEGESEDEGITGVLHDWDLATSHNTQGASDSGKAERTGTIPSVALDLIKNWEQPYKRRYRHDLESFGWCLVYFCLDHSGNWERLEDWHNSRHSRAHRVLFLGEMEIPKPCPGLEHLYKFAQDFMEWLMENVAPPRGKKRKNWEEPEDSKVWDDVLNFLQDDDNKNLLEY